MVMMMVYDVGLIAVKNHNCWLVMSNVLGENTGTVNIDDPWHYYPFRIAILEYIIHKYAHLIKLYLNISYVSISLYIYIYRVYMYIRYIGI